MFNQNIFCKNVKKLREAKGLNRYEMSIQANIIYQYYCSIEKGVKKPNFRAVINIANALNTDIAHLMAETDGANINIDTLKTSIMSQIKITTDETLLQKYYDFLILLKLKMDASDYHD